MIELATKTDPEPQTDPTTKSPSGDPVPEGPDGGGDFTYVKTPDGYEKVPTAWLKDRLAVQNESVTQPESENEVYVSLADGSTEKVKQGQLPGYAGTNAPYGFWNNLTITNIYPA